MMILLLVRTDVLLGGLVHVLLNHGPNCSSMYTRKSVGLVQSVFY